MRGVTLKITAPSDFEWPTCSDDTSVLAFPSELIEPATAFSHPSELTELATAFSHPSELTKLATAFSRPSKLTELATAPSEPSEFVESATAPSDPRELPQPDTARSDRKSPQKPRRPLRMTPLPVRWPTALVLGIMVLETTYLGMHTVAATRRTPVNELAVLPARSITGPFAAPLPTAALLAAGLVASNVGPAADPVEMRKPALGSPGPVPTSPRTPEARRTESPRPATEILPPDSPGWVSLDLPIQVQVFEHGRFVGTNDSGRLALAAGSHELELVNEALQYRSTQTVNILPDSVVPVQMTLPSGTLSLNALPWSDVLIDGQVVGATPLGHLRLSIGPHRVVFRHPQLGEQTRTAVITVGNETRLVVDLRK